MKIAMTGGTGFIGSRVVQELQRKHQVLVLTRRLSDLKKIENDLRKFRPDAVIHLAWEGIPNVGPEMSAKNLVQSLKFFELVGALAIPKLVAAGSAWQYEDDEELAAHNHASFVSAKNALRVFGEEIMKGHTGVFVWGIPFFVYGSGKKSVSLVPSLLAQARDGKSPTPKNPNASHDYIYVDDVARAFALMAVKNVASGSYDIGSGKLTRNGEIATEIARLYQLPAPALGRSKKKKGYAANTRRLQKAAGWKPLMGIRQGLQDMTKKERR